MQELQEYPTQVRTVQDWLLLLYQETLYLSFGILHLFCKLFAGNALQLADKALCSLVAARDGVNRAVNDLGDGQFGNPESGQVFRAEMPVLVKVAVAPGMIGRQGLWFQIWVWIGEVIFRGLVMVGLFPFFNLCQQIRVDLVFKLLIDVHGDILSPMGYRSIS